MNYCRALHSKPETSTTYGGFPLYTLKCWKPSHRTCERGSQVLEGSIYQNQSEDPRPKYCRSFKKILEPFSRYLVRSYFFHSHTTFWIANPLQSSPKTHLAVSLKTGTPPPYRPRYTMILIMGTPKKDL